MCRYPTREIEELMNARVAGYTRELVQEAFATTAAHK
jgi:hypothetical protein